MQYIILAIWGLATGAVTSYLLIDANDWTRTTAKKFSVRFAGCAFIALGVPDAWITLVHRSDADPIWIARMLLGDEGLLSGMALGLLLVWSIRKLLAKHKLAH